MNHLNIATRYMVDARTFQSHPKVARDLILKWLFVRG